MTVPRKPGGIFRDVLSGMLSGLAASSMSTDHPSGAAGFALGVQGAQQNRNLMQERARQQAQRTATSMQQRQQMTDAEQEKSKQDNLAAASIATNTMTALFDVGHNTGFHTEDEHDRLANATSLVKKSALNNGGVLAAIDGNGKPGNGPALMAAFNKSQGELMHAPDGFHRIPFIEHDTAGLVNRDGQWFEKDGSPADWNKHSTVTLVDLPTAAWNQKVTLTRRDANAVAGYQISPGNPTGTLSTTFGSLFALGTKNLKQVADDRKERERGPKDANEAQSWVSATEGADENSPDYNLTVARGKKGQAFLDQKPDKPEKLSGEELAFKEYLDGKPNKPMTRLQFHQQWEKKPEKPDAGPLWAGKADVFGSPIGGPEVDRKEYNKRYDSFSKDYIQPLNRLKKTDVELTRIMDSPAMTGAQKVTGLLAAVGISGDPLQGKGFRINQAIVGEHAGARNIWEGAVQRANQIVGSGGPITEKQVHDYESIARDVVHDAYVAAGSEAHRQGLPVDFLPKGGGQTIDPGTAKLYLDIAGGDKDTARKAAQAQGWRF